MPRVVQTLLFTDVVSSTDRLQQVGDAAWLTLLARHHREIRKVVEEYGGVEVDTAGDGFFVRFDSPGPAVRAACAAVERVSELGVQVRVGLHAGEVELEAGGVVGVAVHLAARVMARANGTEVLISSTVRDLLAGSRMQFIDRGHHRLKGFAEEWQLYAVDLTSVQELSVVRAGADSANQSAAARQGHEYALPFPRLLSIGSTVDYVGRDGTLARLNAARAEAASGSCRVVLLAGEPGVGKTRTAAEVAEAAFGAGATVLFGRCDEDPAAPYQPFVEALEWYVDHDPDPVLGKYAGDLARLDPLLRQRVPGLPPETSSDPRFEEHLVFEATRSWVVELAGRKPVVLVLDDLHWATKPVMLMLSHVVRAAMATDESLPLLVVGTYRTSELDPTDLVSIMLADLRGYPIVHHVVLTGLSVQEVELLVARAAGRELDTEGRRLCSLIHAETEGNPFFVREVLRDLVETGIVKREGDRWEVVSAAPLSVPDTVKDVVRRRTAALPDPARNALATAAIVGRDFQLEVLADVTALPDIELLDGLDAAIRAQLIDETTAGRYRFAHALVRAALFEDLSAARRRRLHLQIGESLERVRPDDVAALAHHFAAAGDAAWPQAVQYGLAAAERALQARALADAEAGFRAVLELLERASRPPDTQRLQGLCGLGEAQRDQGNHEFRRTLLHAARLARELGDVPQLIRAVLANSRGLPSVIGAIDAERVTLTETALQLVGTQPSADRARLLAHLAAEVAFGGDDDRRVTLSDAAEDMARDLHDDRLLAWVLTRTGYAAFTPDRVQRILERAEEATHLADLSADSTEQVLSRYYLSGALLTTGQIDRFRDVTAEMLTLSRDAPPLVQWFALIVQARVAILEGRFAEGERINDEALQLAQHLGEEDGFNWWGSVAVGLELYRGGLAGVADAIAGFSATYPNLRAWWLMHIFALSSAGRLVEAREAMARQDLRPDKLIDDVFPFLAAASICAISFYVDDPDLAHEAKTALEPYAEAWAHPYTMVSGPVTAWLALAVFTSGEPDEAVSLLERADEQLSAAGCRGLLPLIRLHLAEALRRRGDERDTERALSVLNTLKHNARELDAPALVDHADLLLSQLTADHAAE